MDNHQKFLLVIVVVWLLFMGFMQVSELVRLYIMNTCR